MIAIAIATVAGLMLLALIYQDAFEVMLLPRRVSRRWRLVRLYFRGTWAVWAAFGRRMKSEARRERFLSIFGALSMMCLFGLWSVGVIVAFGLLQWAAQQWNGAPATSDLAEQIYLSGVTFFTLGDGVVMPHTPPAHIITVVEAASGFGLIAVVIGYLPVLYQLFSRREAHVIQLDGRAGSPPTATTMLRRHAESDGLDKLDELLRSWEIWGADLLESHLSYPMLAYYRSQHDDQSWLAAVAAILDVCALILVGVEDVKPLQARMTFAMARQVVVEMARSLGVTAARNPGTARLDHDSFEKMLAVFEEVGLHWNGGSEGEEALHAIRSTYEPVLLGLGEYLLTPLPGWIAAGRASDHWERGARGIIARRLIDGLASGAIDTGNPPKAKRGLIGRLRDG
jgi:nitrate reductase NapE component